MEELVIIERIFSTYRKPVYDRINKYISLKLLYGRNNSGIKTARASYAKPIYSIQYGKKDTNVLLFPVTEILKTKPKIIICDLAIGMLNLPVIICLCKLLKIKIAFWSHGYNRKTGFVPEKRLIDRYRLFLMRWVDANIVYSQYDKNIIGEYLDNPIFVAQNTLDTKAFSTLHERLEKEGRVLVKKRLKITQDFNIVFIGRLLTSKMPELLINVYDQLLSVFGLRIGVHFIGDGDILRKLKNIAAKRVHPEDFYFYGSIYDYHKSGEILYSCDLMVNPGAVGLSVNQVFCFDCPVVSFENENGERAHGPEVEYVVNGKTGFLIKDNDVDCMTRTIFKYFENEDLRTEMQNNIRLSVKNVFPIEKMVQGVIDCVKHLSV